MVSHFWLLSFNIVFWSSSCYVLFIYLFLDFFLSFCHFLGRSWDIWRFPGQGLNRNCSHQPTPEPQQRGIGAASATYTTAHGNAGSSTHWTRLGIEPETSWFLVGFINHWAMTGTPIILCFRLYQYLIQFFGWIIFHCTDMPPFVYPFMSWWTLGLFPFFSS